MCFAGLQEQDAVRVQNLAGPPARDPEEAGDVGATHQLVRGIHELPQTIGAALLPGSEHGQQFPDDGSEDDRQDDVDQSVPRLIAEADRHRGRNARDSRQRRGADGLGEPDEYECHTVEGQEGIELAADRAGDHAECGQHHQERHEQGPARPPAPGQVEVGDPDHGHCHGEQEQADLVAGFGQEHRADGDVEGAEQVQEGGQPPRAFPGIGGHARRSDPTSVTEILPALVEPVEGILQPNSRRTRIRPHTHLLAPACR